ncbi:MAG: HAMP domain-containing histidine kinase [Deltaproteobacteria bacterium]|nr:HAMP domain-containing histidine kinase [Deltaproteobacteria bacterium]
MQRQKERYRSAYLLSDKVATESLDIALATTMAEMGNFLHEMRNALTSITPNLRYLEKDLTLDEDQSDALQSAIKAGDRATDLVDKVLSTIQDRATFRTSTFSLPDVVDETILSSGLRSLTRVGEIPEFQINGAPDHLRAVILNIAQNALQSGARRVRISGDYDGGLKRAILEITDDGPGIPEKNRETIFKPSDSSPKGTGHGLGLPLSKRLVELLGGELELGQTDPSGTTFVIRLSGRHIPTSMPPKP